MHTMLQHLCPPAGAPAAAAVGGRGAGPHSSVPCSQQHPPAGSAGQSPSGGRGRGVPGEAAGSAGEDGATRHTTCGGAMHLLLWRSDPCLSSPCMRHQITNVRFIPFKVEETALINLIYGHRTHTGKIEVIS